MRKPKNKTKILAEQKRNRKRSLRAKKTAKLKSYRHSIFILAKKEANNKFNKKIKDLIGKTASK